MGITAIKVTVQYEKHGKDSEASVLNQKGLGGKLPHQVCFEFCPMSLGHSVMLCLEGESAFVCSYQKFIAFLYNHHF